MNFEIPVFIDKYDGVYRASPLFYEFPRTSSPRLEYALRRLRNKLEKSLLGAIPYPRHEVLAKLVFSPELTLEQTPVTVKWRKECVDLVLPFALFQHLGQTIALTPALADLWFSIESKETLRARAEEVIEAHLKLLDQTGRNDIVLGFLGRKYGKSFLTSVELQVVPRQTLEINDPEEFFSISSFDSFHGPSELL